MRGRTVLIPKKGCQGRPEQYRPITCLNTGYKLLTSVITILLRSHIESNSILPVEQKALRRQRRGCLDALLVDSMVCGEARCRKKSLSVAWIDYTKAYDRVPHEWILEVLKSIGAPQPLWQCISDLIPKWSSVFSVGTGRNAVKATLKYHRGLFQGDSLSPLLFCLCIAPLSCALNGLKTGFRSVEMGDTISHTLFMDDLKVYAASKKGLERTLSVVDRVSEAVGMQLGLQKCAVAHISKGRTIEGGDLSLSNDRVLRAAGRGNPYAYLGIKQVFEPDLAAIKKGLMDMYVLRLRRIWSSELNGRNKVQASNVWAVALFRYFFACLKWTRQDLVKLDRTTRRLIRKFRCHQYGAAVERVTLPRGRGGRGLASLVHIFEREVLSTVSYVCDVGDPQLKGVFRHWLFLGGQHRCNILQSAQAILEKYQMEVLLSEEGARRPSGDRVAPRLLARLLKEAQMEALVDSLCQKKIHGCFYKQCQGEGWDTSGSHAWFLDGRLRGQTEGLVVAAQDGVIFTRAYRARVLKEKNISTSCRVCGSAVETLGHLLSRCHPYDWTLYKQRHDRVLYQVLLALCRKFKITIPDSMKWGASGWSGVGVLESSEVKMLLDVSTPTDRMITERRPDLVVFLYATRCAYILEVACAWDPLVVEREKEKRLKYAEYAADLATQWRGWRTSVHPLVVGDLASLGSFREELNKTHLFSKRDISFLARNCQFEALCSAVRIIRRHLSYR